MKYLILCAFFMISALGVVSAATAQSSKNMFGHWPIKHWEDQDFIPYYTNGTDPHNTQWNGFELNAQNWTPAQWVALNKWDGLGLIQRWYTADIVRDQMVEDDVPTLVVGPNFYHLSGADKRRVIQTIDHVYGVTQVKPRLFYLKDWGTGRHIGYYSPQGLVLQ